MTRHTALHLKVAAQVKQIRGAHCFNHDNDAARRYAVVVKPKPHYPEKDGLELPTNEELGI